MRPFVIAAAFIVATGALAPSRAAAQNPDSPPPPATTQDVAVPRGSAPPPPTPAPAPAASERRGSVRAPQRAVDRPSRTETPASEPRVDVPAGPSAASRASSTASAAAEDAEEQRERRRGSVRQPPQDRGSRSGDRAVARGSVPPPTRTVVRNYPYRYYPNYSRYYDPWGYGSFGLGYFYYSPWAWGPYGGYGYPGYYPPYGAYGYDVGSVRVKVSPRDAEVWVDGYYAGLVDDFDGMFQALKLDSGPYRIEIRKPGFETLSFDVRVLPERTITFRGTLRPAP
jgi:hypothetical protein